MKFIIISLCFIVISLSASSLDELVDMALNNNTAIKQVKLNVELSQKRRDANSKARFGEVDILASYNHYNTPRTLIPLTLAVIQSGQHVTTTKDLFSIGASYNVAFNSFSLVPILAVRLTSMKLM